MKKLLRIYQIHRVLVRHGLDRLLQPIDQAKGLRLLLWLTPWEFLHVKRNEGSEAERIREALVELGPIFVKFGQMLSTRRDLLPCLLYTSPSPRDKRQSRMPSSA